MLPHRRQVIRMKMRLPCRGYHRDLPSTHEQRIGNEGRSEPAKAAGRNENPSDFMYPGVVGSALRCVRDASFQAHRAGTIPDGTGRRQPGFILSTRTTVYICRKSFLS